MIRDRNTAMPATLRSRIHLALVLAVDLANLAACSWLLYFGVSNALRWWPSYKALPEVATAFAMVASYASLGLYPTVVRLAKRAKGYWHARA